MGPFENLLAATSEVAIEQEVAMYHDTVRVSYTFWPKNKVESFEDFTNVISNYCSYHYPQCCEDGELMFLSEIANKGISIVEQEYRKCGGDIFTAYKDARDAFKS